MQQGVAGTEVTEKSLRGSLVLVTVLLCFSSSGDSSRLGQFSHCWQQEGRSLQAGMRVVLA